MDFPGLLMDCPPQVLPVQDGDGWFARVSASDFARLSIPRFYPAPDFHDQLPGVCCFCGFGQPPVLRNELHSVSSGASPGAAPLSRPPMQHSWSTWVRRGGCMRIIPCGVILSHTKSTWVTPLAVPSSLDPEQPRGYKVGRDVLNFYIRDATLKLLFAPLRANFCTCTDVESNMVRPRPIHIVRLKRYVIKRPGLIFRQGA